MSNPPSPSPAQPSKKATFFRRLFSTVVLWTIVILSIFSGNKLVANSLFLLIMATLTALGLREFYDLARKRDLVCFKGWGIAAGLLFTVCSFVSLSRISGGKYDPTQAGDLETAFLALFVLGLCARQFVAKNNSAGLVAISTTLFGLMYVPWLLNFIQKINFFPNVDGRLYVLFFILVTKFSDLGAYVTGSLIGKHKMIPRISPNKTWEGFGGAIAISTGSAMLFAWIAGPRLGGMTLPHAAILGVILSCSAVVGDLIESLFKREAGLKDSGSFFPGIGGILDLLDSLLFNAPIMYLYLRHILA